MVLQSTSSYRHTTLSTGIGFLFPKALECKFHRHFSVVSLHKIVIIYFTLIFSSTMYHVLNLLTFIILIYFDIFAAPRVEII